MFPGFLLDHQRTASAEEADIVDAYRLGANAFLIKPPEANKLEEMVKAIRDFWLTHNRLPHESASEALMEGVVARHVSTTAFAPEPAR